MSYTQPTSAEIAVRRASLAPFDGWNERAFAQIVAWMGIPPRYLDVGSGTGAMVNMAQRMGIDALGVDLISKGPGDEHWFIQHDLTTPLTLPGTFDLITSLEVAEHLPLDSHDTFVATIAQHIRPAPAISQPSGLFVFSAAPPGQPGEHHVGCRPAHEWRSMFYEAGISYREDYTRQLAHLFGWVTGPASHWLAANLSVYDRGTL